MTKAEIGKWIYVILGAAKDAQGKLPGGAISGHLYAALMQHMDLDRYQKLVDCLVNSGLVTLSGHVITITPKGEAFYQQLEEAMMSGRPS